MGEKTLLTMFPSLLPCCYHPAAPVLLSKQHNFNLVTAINLIAFICSSVSQLPMIPLRNQFTLTHVGTQYYFYWVHQKIITLSAN